MPSTGNISVRNTLPIVTCLGKHLRLISVSDVRIAALEALVQVVRADSRFDDWKFLLDIIENDPEPRVRHQLLLMLAEHPPFEKGRGSHLDTIPVMERLWKLMK
jgi:transcription initiation factor TFIID subunit 2